MEKEKALKDVAADIAKEKGKAVEVTEKKAKVVKKAQLVVEKKLAKVEEKLGGIKLKLAQAESLTLAQVDEIADLKAALDTAKDKGYNQGFADAENSMEPIVHQAQTHGFGEGWLTALQAMGVAKDSPLRISSKSSTQLQFSSSKAKPMLPMRKNLKHEGAGSCH